jgi:hypothetical protein
LRSGLDSDLLVGSAGFLVEREAGRIVVFGSAYSTDIWLANDEKGFKVIGVVRCSVFGLDLSRAFIDEAIRELGKPGRNYLL